MRMVRDDRYKLIWYPAGNRVQMFDMLKDCGEINDLGDDAKHAGVRERLTKSLIAHLYGLRYMGTLYGIVFFSHQLGSFLGVWLGGRMYDIYGSYTAVWWVGVGVGAFSALVHLPVREARPVAAGT